MLLSVCGYTAILLPLHMNDSQPSSPSANAVFNDNCFMRKLKCQCCAVLMIETLESFEQKGLAHKVGQKEQILVLMITSNVLGKEHQYSVRHSLCRERAQPSSDSTGPDISPALVAGRRLGCLLCRAEEHRAGACVKRCIQLGLLEAICSCCNPVTPGLAELSPQQ